MKSKNKKNKKYRKTYNYIYNTVMLLTSFKY